MDELKVYLSQNNASNDSAEVAQEEEQEETISTIRQKINKERLEAQQETKERKTM